MVHKTNTCQTMKYILLILLILVSFENYSQILKEKELLKDGDVVINTASMPLHKRFRTNALKITLVE